MTSLDAAEARMLALCCERARLADRDRILELGCGWGSLTLWMAGHYPNARITAVSNSHSQKAFIDARAAERGLRCTEHWRVSGTQYRQTAEAWLANMDRQRAGLMPVLEATYGAAAALRWWVYWRVFFMSCAELFGYHGGTEWLVSHCLFEKP